MLSFIGINAQSRTFEDALRGANIPYQIVGGIRFYERMEVKDIIAYMRVIVNPADTVSIKRIINVPRRGIGVATVQKIEDFAYEEGIPLFEAIQRVGEVSTLNNGAKNKVRAFAELIASFNPNDPPARAADDLLDRSGYLQALRNEDTIEAQSREENLRELIAAVAEYEESEPEPTLTGFLARITLVSDIDNMEDKSDVVTMMTLHSAKGLEFPIVFMVGIEEGLLPHQRSYDTEAELEEERRLCYVGLTRAQEHVYLTYARSRRLYRDIDYRIPSRFIEEIPPNWLIRELPTSRLGARWFHPTIPMNPIMRRRFHSLTTLGTLYTTQSSVEERLPPSMGMDLKCGSLCALNAGLRKPSLRRMRGCSGWVKTRRHPFNLNIT